MQNSSVDLTAFQLKWAALCAMTLDHLGLMGAQLGWAFAPALRVIGRVSMPLFLFLFAESLRYTGSRNRLLLRVFLTAVLHAGISAVLMRLTGCRFFYGNILYTFLYVGLTVSALEGLRGRRLLPAFLLCAVLAAGTLAEGHTASAMLLPSLWGVDYSWPFVLLGVLLYLLPQRRVELLLAFSFLSLLLPADAAFTQTLGLSALAAGNQWCMALAAPLLFFYHHNRGTGPKYFFYLYYPLHQYVLLLLFLKSS